MKQKRRGRNCFGQGLAECGASLVVLVMLVTGGIIFLVDVGTYLVLKMQVANAADACAQYVADQTIWLGAPRPSPYFSSANIQSRTNALAMQILTNEQISTSSVSVNIDQSQIDNCTVSITMQKVPLLVNAFLPQQFTITESGCEPYSNDPPIGVVGFSFTNGGVTQGAYLPCYGAGVGASGPTSYPLGNFPYWQGQMNASVMTGPFQNSGSGGPFTSY